MESSLFDASMSAKAVRALLDESLARPTPATCVLTPLAAKDVAGSDTPSTSAPSAPKPEGWNVLEGGEVA